MKDFLLGVLSTMVIVLFGVIFVILNIDIYFDTCWEDRTCEVQTRKVIQLILEDY